MGRLVTVFFPHPEPWRRGNLRHGRLFKCQGPLPPSRPRGHPRPHVLLQPAPDAWPSTRPPRPPPPTTYSSPTVEARGQRRAFPDTPMASQCSPKVYSSRPPRPSSLPQGPPPPPEALNLAAARRHAGFEFDFFDSIFNFDFDFLAVLGTGRHRTPPLGAATTPPATSPLPRAPTDLHPGWSCGGRRRRRF